MRLYEIYGLSIEVDFLIHRDAAVLYDPKTRIYLGYGLDLWNDTITWIGSISWNNYHKADMFFIPDIFLVNLLKGILKERNERIQKNNI